MKKNLIIGNWKMNGDLETNQNLINSIVSMSHDLNDTEVVICPPVIYLYQVRDLIAKSDIKLGAQNVCVEASGAFTGELSVNMLNEFGCKYTLVGHSERRRIYNESSIEIAQKITQLLNVGQTPVLCIGETLQEHEDDISEQVVINQIQVIVEQIGIEKLRNIVLAYEPVWAIGTGKTASPEQAQKIHKVIREYLHKLEPELAKNASILYGGSVTDTNADNLIMQQDIDGFLVGGASLKAESFINICRAGQANLSLSA